MKIELTSESQRVLQMLVDIGAYATIEEAANARIARAEERRTYSEGASEEVAKRQQVAHRRIMEGLRESPDPPMPNDGLSNRDHDEIIYGG